ncbi:MAG: extracellular solute-binding protein [Acidiferrobacterales bacterium]
MLLIFSSTLAGHLAHGASSVALGYTPKYRPGFSHFDYVNPFAPRGGTLVLHGDGNFDSFNPYVLKGVTAEGLPGAVFEPLMVSSLDEPYSLYGHLASDIQIASDKKSVIFRIDSRARFSDGATVTAQDVKFTFDIIKKKGHPFYRFLWADIKRAQVLGRYTIKFSFSRVYPELPLIAAQIPVFSKKWVGDTPFEKLSRTLPIGTGPYVVEKYRLGKQITYKRNSDYWAANKNTRRGMFNFDKIIYKYYKDETIRLEALKAGEFHFLHENYSKLWAREHVGSKYDSGKIKKILFSHGNNAGIQGFVFNTRKSLFKDRRVRKAIGLAYDFSWANRNLFYNQYIRSDSYFSNSELAATALPKGAELRLLRRYQKKYPRHVPRNIFTEVWRPSQMGDAQSRRDHLKRAKALLEQAGWHVHDGVLQNGQGQRMEFAVMLAGRGFERILDAFAHNLKKLGITIRYRTIDISLYLRRARTFDFDMLVSSYPQSQLPGKELVNYWHSSTADQEGSRNYAGIKNPVVDALIEDIVSTSSRSHRVIVARALDRILLHGEYLVPNWYIASFRVAYWDRFKYPERPPLFYDPTRWAVSTWWNKKSYRQQLTNYTP